eukprot:CAMPEP_0172692600 /NCGR_PEP_ID=MMETSP1074-20121228/25379_1 /TAXON_ID=2916 /ORGANISM="Ceratium fusus, Strain PA161109" /LENGTH=46 /DNA_ID= /DNA_START= /DNA_END= /DNA_ORIENTATION=
MTVCLGTCSTMMFASTGDGAGTPLNCGRTEPAMAALGWIFQSSMKK